MNTKNILKNIVPFFITLLLIAIITAGCRSNGISAHDTWDFFTSCDQVNGFVTSGSEVWAATDGGVGVWDREQDTFRVYRIQDGLPDNRIQIIISGVQGDFWAATNFGITHFTGDTWQNIGGPVNAWKILTDQAGCLWVLSLTSGISCYSGQSWQYFSETDGLPQVTYSSLVIDKRGNIWVATVNGVSCYDGKSWRNFSVADWAAGSTVNVISVDSRGRVWLGTDEGVAVYDGLTWTTFILKDGLSDPYISSILEAKDGTIWCGGIYGINRYDELDWQTFKNEDVYMQSLLAVDAKGNLWVNRKNGGISLFDGNDWQTFFAPDNQSSIWGTSAALDERGDLLIGTASGIRIYDGSTWTTLRNPAAPGGNSVRSMLKDHRGNFWFVTDYGISRYDGTSWVNYSEEDGLGWGEGLLSPVFEDAGGNIWFASPGGINRFDGKVWKVYNEKDGVLMNYTDVAAIMQQKNGNIWFATRYNYMQGLRLPGDPGPGDEEPKPSGIHYFDGQSWHLVTTEDGLFNDDVLTIAEANDGAVWFGTYQGACRYDGNSWQTFTTDDGLVGNDVETIIKDKMGNLWFVTSVGLNRYDGKTWQVFNSQEFQNIYPVILDTKGNIWFGGLGVLCYDGVKWQVFTGSDGLPGTTNDIAEDQKGNIWIAAEQGLGRYNGQSWQTITLSDGLMYKHIISLIVDRQGSIWCVTAYGLARYNP